MKNRYFILSVLFWAIASVCMAITLPSSSYNSYESYESYDMGNEGYTLGIGTTFKNTSMLSTYNPGTCQEDKQDPNILQNCQECCVGAVLSKGGSESDYYACMNDCIGVSLPLGSPLLLLPFLAIYAVIRKRKEETL